MFRQIIVFNALIFCVIMSSCSNDEPTTKQNNNRIQYHKLSDYDILGETHNAFLDYAKNHEADNSNELETRAIVDVDATPHMDYLHSLQLEYVETIEFNNQEDKIYLVDELSFYKPYYEETILFANTYGNNDTDWPITSQLFGLYRKKQIDSFEYNLLNRYTKYARAAYLGTSSPDMFKAQLDALAEEWNYHYGFTVQEGGQLSAYVLNIAFHSIGWYDQEAEITRSASVVIAVDAIGALSGGATAALGQYYKYGRVVNYKTVALSALASGVVSSCGGWARILKWGAKFIL